MQHGIMHVLDYQPEEQLPADPLLELAEEVDGQTKKVLDEVPGIIQLDSEPVDKLPPKRGDTVVFMDSQNNMAEVTGRIVAVTVTPVPHNYTMLLVVVKGMYYIIASTEDWLRMADGVRQVENNTVSTVEEFLSGKEVQYMSMTSAKYGGKSGLNASFVANRLWYPITGKKLKPNEVII